MSESPRFESSTYEKAKQQLQEAGLTPMSALDAQIQEAKTTSTEARSKLNREIATRDFIAPTLSSQTSKRTIPTPKFELQQEVNLASQEAQKVKPNIQDPNRTETNTDKYGLQTITQYKDGKIIRKTAISPHGHMSLSEYNTNGEIIKDTSKYKDGNISQGRISSIHFVSPESYTEIKNGIRTSGIMDKGGEKWINALSVRLSDGVIMGEYVDGKYSRNLTNIRALVNKQAEKEYDNAVKLYPGTAN